MKISRRKFIGAGLAAAAAVIAAPVSSLAESLTKTAASTTTKSKDYYVELVQDITERVNKIGSARKILLEDFLTPGIPVEYDTLDANGNSLICRGSDGEVRIVPFEGKKTPVSCFRITTPVIDPKLSREEIIEKAAKSIAAQEDARVALLLATSATKYGNKPFDGPKHRVELGGVTYEVARSDYLGVIPTMYKLDGVALEDGLIFDEYIGMQILNPSKVRVVR